ncbi:ABC transporter substrate-binding protein [Mycobacterium sp. NAZ190054]|uniref:ABC transporter substrate-binding protein n=1 Tax=Mycobacterium sp. NAZ190054 TaxID=1747766 RepID=UPI000796233E|nr:ABC transporter substrate-binding protein [Mycobacterium sp. NAZ190054]KWX60689.1 ABC transporter substrate-binding protein [Mycobacterium sp. NAZ190054]
MLSRRSALALSLGAVGAAFMGCSSSDSAIADGKAVNFTSWVFGTSGAGPTNEAVNRFEQRSGIAVRTRSYPYEQYLNQLVLKSRSGNASGLVHIDEEWMSTLVTAGVLADIGPLVDTARYPDFVRAAGTYRGTRYAIPWTQSAIGIVSNAGLCQQFGVDIGTIRTIDSFTQALRTIKRAEPSLIPYLPCTDVTQLKDILPWMWAFGSPILTDGTLTLGDEGSVQAVEYWKMLIDEGLIQAGIIRDDARTLFGQQRAVFYDDAPQAIGVVPKRASDPDIADKMRPIARPARDGLGHNLVWSQPLVALSEGPAVEALMQYMSTDEAALQIMFEEAGQPPATVQALESSWFSNNGFYTDWNAVVAPASRVNPLWSFPKATAAQQHFDECIEAALGGTVPVSQALRDAKEGLQEQLGTE